MGVLVEGETQPSYALVDMCQLISERDFASQVHKQGCGGANVGASEDVFGPSRDGSLKHASAIQLMYCLILRA